MEVLSIDKMNYLREDLGIDTSNAGLYYYMTTNGWELRLKGSHSFNFDSETFMYYLDVDNSHIIPAYTVDDVLNEINKHYNLGVKIERDQVQVTYFHIPTLEHIEVWFAESDGEDWIVESYDEPKSIHNFIDVLYECLIWLDVHEYDTFIREKPKVEIWPKYLKFSMTDAGNEKKTVPLRLKGDSDSGHDSVLYCSPIDAEYLVERHLLITYVLYGIDRSIIGSQCEEITEEEYNEIVNNRYVK